MQIPGSTLSPGAKQPGRSAAYVLLFWLLAPRKYYHSARKVYGLSPGVTEQPRVSSSTAPMVPAQLAVQLAQTTKPTTSICRLLWDSRHGSKGLIVTSCNNMVLGLLQALNIHTARLEAEEWPGHPWRVWRRRRRLPQQQPGIKDSLMWDRVSRS